MAFALAALLVAIIGGSMTAVAGAGTGSTLIPLFALRFDFKLAVAAIALPHLAALAVRSFQLREKIDRGLFIRFGILCAAASLIGALLQAQISSRAVTYAFAVLLVIAGITGFVGKTQQKRGGQAAAWIAGAASGFFGGLAGEQGGFRAVGLLRFDLDKEAFVATSSAVGVLIDLFRAPIYLHREWERLFQTWDLVALATAGAITGILIGQRLLRRVPQEAFSRTVSGVILLIGLLLFFR